MKKSLITRRLTVLLLVLAMLLPMILTGCHDESDSTGTKAPNNDATGAEGTLLYTITVKGEGGMLLSDVTVKLFDMQGIETATGKTNDKGEYQAWLYPAKYTVKVEGLKAGYSAQDVTTTEQGGLVEVVANTELITDQYPNQPDSYAIGDVMYDFAFVKDGKEVKLSELLETKKLVVLNFWYRNCSPCRAEFPAIQQAYEQYSDDVAFVALSTTDSLEVIQEFQSENGYTFDMVKDVGMFRRFTKMAGAAVNPTTIFIDRYGVITQCITGGDPNADAWKAEFAWYISDEYAQTGSSGYQEPDDDDTPKPDVDMPASADIEAAINGQNGDGSKFTTTYTPSESETVWPWVLGEADGKKVIEPSNYGEKKPYTSALINFATEIKEGQVLAFDFKYSIEYDTYGTTIYDMFAVYVDGHIMQKMVSPKDGWVTCYAYVGAEIGTHEITLAYTKDESDSRDFMDPGKEYVYVTNLRLLDVKDVIAEGESIDIYRAGAYGVPSDEEAASMTTSYKHYIDVVFNENDGYYHVGTENGPLLLTKLTGSTAWSPNALSDLGEIGLLVIDNINYYIQFDAINVRSYVWLEGYSNLGYTPVDAKLAQLLDLVVSNVGDGKNHALEWLELCCYFQHYGEGDGICHVTDVRQGLDELSAFEAQEGRNHVNVNRVFVPRGHYFRFVPNRTGVYTFYSVSEGATTSDTSGQIDTIAWLFDDEGNELDWGDSQISDKRGDHFQIWRTLEAGKTYYIAVGFDPVDQLGQFDFMIEYVGDKMDVVTVCTDAWTTTEDFVTTIIYRNYGIEAELDEDGYYRQVLYYDENGEPVLDMSDTGYLYVDFLGVSKAEGVGYLHWVDDYCTLEKYIRDGYYTYDATKAEDILPGAFDFSSRKDVLSDKRFEYMKEFGNCQPEMEEYLRQALAVDKDDPMYGFVKADKRLAEILDCLMMMYGLTNNVGTATGPSYVAVEDQWMMFACFCRHV